MSRPDKRCAALFVCVDSGAGERRQDLGPLVLLLLALLVLASPFMRIGLFKGPVAGNVASLSIGRDSNGLGIIYQGEPDGGEALLAVGDLREFPHLAPLFFQPVALNKADIMALSAVRGIGPKLASRIIQMRQKKGGFLTINELLEVQGIGPQKLVVLQQNFRI